MGIATLHQLAKRSHQTTVIKQRTLITYGKLLDIISPLYLSEWTIQRYGYRGSCSWSINRNITPFHQAMDRPRNHNYIWVLGVVQRKMVKKISIEMRGEIMCTCMYTRYRMLTLNCTNVGDCGYYLRAFNSEPNGDVQGPWNWSPHQHRWR